jgi:hypothetical protein
MVQSGELRLVYWGVTAPSGCERTMLRMEDRIRRLCAELLAAKSDEEAKSILVELRDALHVHIERLRDRFGAYPFLVERRARNDGVPVKDGAAANKASLADTGT